MPLNKLISRFSRYCFVGIANTLFCVGCMWLFAYLGFGYLTYTAIAYLLAMLLSFSLNLIFTFRVSGNIPHRLIRFFGVNLINLGIVELLEFLLIHELHIPTQIGIALAMGCYVVLGFLLNQKWVFNAQSTPPVEYRESAAHRPSP